jgi:hypothetical protein
MSINAGSYLEPTCLKWGADVNLTTLDMALVLKRLAQVDLDVAPIGGSLGYEVSGEELLRLCGHNVVRSTGSKQESPGEYR